MLVPGVEECLSPSPRRFFRFRVSLSKPNDVRNIQLHPSFHTGTVYFIHKHLFNSCRLDLSDFQSSLKHLYISISSANSESCRGCSFCCKNFELFDNVITVGSGIACEKNLGFMILETTMIMWRKVKILAAKVAINATFRIWFYCLEIHPIL